MANSAQQKKLEQHQLEQQRRDSTTFFLLGGFFVVMGTLVVIGTLWTLARPHAMVVNLVSGLLLLTIGSAMVAFGARVRRKSLPPVTRSRRKTMR